MTAKFTPTEHIKEIVRILELTEAFSFDLFPRMWHVETVVLMSRVDR